MWCNLKNAHRHETRKHFRDARPALQEKNSPVLCWKLCRSGSVTFQIKWLIWRKKLSFIYTVPGYDTKFKTYFNWSIKKENTFIFRNVMKTMDNERWLMKQVNYTFFFFFKYTSYLGWKWGTGSSTRPRIIRSLMKSRNFLVLVSHRVLVIAEQFTRIIIFTNRYCKRDVLWSESVMVRKKTRSGSA